MMKVTRTTFGMIAENRAKASKKYTMVQRMKKDGNWGKALQTEKYFKETDEDVVDRLNELNPNSKYRLAQ